MAGACGAIGTLAIQPQTGDDCQRVVRDGGCLVTVSGDQVTPQRQIKVQQVFVGPEVDAALAGVAKKVAAGAIRVELEQVYPFERAVEALEKTETRHARGKVVISL